MKNILEGVDSLITTQEFLDPLTIGLAAGGAGLVAGAYGGYKAGRVVSTYSQSKKDTKDRVEKYTKIADRKSVV